jgi:sulfate transport system substrate-binding protein
MNDSLSRSRAARIALALWMFLTCPGLLAAEATLLHVSNDATRALYDAVNESFQQKWLQERGERLAIRQSHGGSGKQARAVIDGMEADVVSLALALDVSTIAERSGRIPPDWTERAPNHGVPYTSTIVFLVRKGNPENLHDWDDLQRDGITIITPNPKTSGGARLNYLAAWAYALEQSGGDEGAARDFVARIFERVPVLDSGARGSMNTFLRRGIGDVLIAWESEALLAVQELGPGRFEIVVPSLSILAEPSVAVVEENARRKGNLERARAYVDFLFSDAGQTLAARHHYRPVRPDAVDPELLAQFPEVRTFRVEDVFGSWDRAQATHFDDGGVFDGFFLR